ncbi:MAG TPA: right-handed parallel beta-helix repeat-containing protein, partial [Thermoanaerobaculia bacterium]|nr:right-handed parallel beta-helix repeat-containing protein [Thermoanaerobaculia bacterium]
IVVTSTADSGPGTLRAAFEEVNANCLDRACKIDFALAPPVPSEGWFTIVPETPLPVLRAPRVYLDATTQTKLTGDTNPKGPEVAIDGRKAGQGLEIHAECGTLVRGFALGNFHANEALWMTHDRRICVDRTHLERDVFEISENHIGVDPSGTTPWPNRRWLILDDAAALVTDNVISSNTFSGVWMWRGAATFYGNLIERNGASGIFFGPEVQYGEVLFNTINWHRDMGVAVARGARQIDIRRNSMRGNVGLGIDWGLDGPSPVVEDDSDMPTNPPVVLSAVYDEATDETVVTMTLRSMPRTQVFNAWVINVYANDAPDGDGEKHIAEQQLPSVPEGPFAVRARGNHAGKWLNATSSRVHYIVFSRPGEPRTESFGGGETLTSELSNSVRVTP